MVVDHQGSVPGTTGAAMVVSSLGCAGTVGGGTAEHHAIELAHGFDSAPELVDIEHTPDGSGSLCSGRHTMALVRLASSNEATLVAICDTLRAGRVGTLRLSRSGISFEPGDRSAAADDGRDRLQLRHHPRPAGHLTIVGGGHCALALSRVMATLPFRIVVLDDRAELPTLAANRFADEIRTVGYSELAAHVPQGDRSWVVVMTFGHAHDETALRALSGHRVRYLGLLGSSAKVAAMFADARRWSARTWPRFTLRSACRSAATPRRRSRSRSPRRSSANATTKSVWASAPVRVPDEVVVVGLWTHAPRDALRASEQLS
jgi:xanthine dehydrogenase accessory factor